MFTFISCVYVLRFNKLEESLTLFNFVSGKSSRHMVAFESAFPSVPVNKQEKLANTGRHAFFVLTKDKRTLAMARVHVHRFWLYEIRNLYVPKKHRGKGYGKTMVSLLTDLIRTTTMAKEMFVFATTRTDNTPAVRLFEKTGFKKKARFEPKREAFIFEKRLRQMFLPTFVKEWNVDLFSVKERYGLDIPIVFKGAIMSKNLRQFLDDINMQIQTEGLF